MAKTLRVRTASGWTTKPAPDLPENRLLAEEVDDNFLALEAGIAGRAPASHNHDESYADLEVAYSLGTALSGATTLTATNGAIQYGTVIGAVTWTFSGAAAAPLITSTTLELTNGGAFTQTWPSSATLKWDSGTAPTLTAAGLDILVFYTRDGGTTWRGFLAAKDSK